jgi:hypothetical protein
MDSDSSSSSSDSDLNEEDEDDDKDSDDNKSQVDNDWDSTNEVFNLALHFTKTEPNRILFCPIRM